MNSFLIEVDSRLKGRSLQVQKKSERSFVELGLGKIVCLGVGQLYRLEGEISPEEVSRIAQELLSDSVSENFAIDTKPEDGNHFFVDIWYKDGVTDSVGESVLKGVSDIGIKTVAHAAHGKRLRFRRACDSDNEGTFQKKVIQFVDRNLLNPLVQECKITGL